MQAAVCTKEIIRAVLSVWTIQLGLVNWNIYDGRYIIFCQDFVLNPCCSQEISHWPFCIYTCVVVVLDPLKLLLMNSSFFQKYTWTTDLDQHSFLSVFSPYFTFLILEFLKKIGHTGIANTKKWLDQAVFPCWSNYHTLAGE